MKKIPKVITRFEIMLVFNEGKRAYSDSKRRGYNPYADLGHDELSAAWWDGWDNAQADDRGRGNNAAPPMKDEERKPSTD